MTRAPPHAPPPPRRAPPPPQSVCNVTGSTTTQLGPDVLPKRQDAISPVILSLLTFTFQRPKKRSCCLLQSFLRQHPDSLPELLRRIPLHRFQRRIGQERYELSIELITQFVVMARARGIKALLLENNQQWPVHVTP